MAMMRDGSAQILLTVPHKTTTPLTLNWTTPNKSTSHLPKMFSAILLYEHLRANRSSIFKFILFAFPASLLILHDMDWHGAQPKFPSIIRGAHPKHPGITQATGSPHG